MAIRQHLRSDMSTSAAGNRGACEAHHIDEPVRRLVEHTAKNCQWQACDANVSDLTAPCQALHEGRKAHKLLPCRRLSAHEELEVADSTRQLTTQAWQPALCSAPGSVSSTTCCNDPNSISWHWMMSM